MTDSDEALPEGTPVSIGTLYDAELVSDVVRGFLAMNQVERVVFDQLVEATLGRYRIAAFNVSSGEES